MSATRSAPFAIAADHPSLPGHFPGQPIVPGVLVLDRVFALLADEGEAASGWRLPQVKFVRPLLPGEEAVVEAEAGAGGGWKFRVRVGDALVASGELRPA